LHLTIEQSVDDLHWQSSSQPPEAQEKSQLMDAGFHFPVAASHCDGLLSAEAKAKTVASRTASKHAFLDNIIFYFVYNNDSGFTSQNTAPKTTKAWGRPVQDRVLADEADRAKLVPRWHPIGRAVE